MIYCPICLGELAEKINGDISCQICLMELDYKSKKNKPYLRTKDKKLYMPLEWFSLINNENTNSTGS